MHHSNSTYNAFDNNPAYWTDPNGADSWSYIGGTYLNNVTGETTDDWRRAINETVVGSKRNSDKDCPDCDNPFVFAYALVRAAFNEAEETFNLYKGVYEKTATNEDVNSYFRGLSTGQKSTGELIPLGEGIPVRSSERVEIEDVNFGIYQFEQLFPINKEGDVILAGPVKIFSGVSSDLNNITGIRNFGYGENLFEGGREGTLQFLNSEGRVIAHMNFRKKEHAQAFYNFYFSRVRQAHLKSLLKKYDNNNGTNLFKRVFPYSRK